ncbi:MAG: hypothetical protein HQL78_13100 [Magnetococcales bacterium]|nr:hypothetical protein [Magnetococcales bacterium]
MSAVRRFDKTPALASNDVSHMSMMASPTPASVHDDLLRVLSKVTLTCDENIKLHPEIEGLLQIKEELRDGIELAANDLDVINEQQSKAGQHLN